MSNKKSCKAYYVIEDIKRDIDMKITQPCVADFKTKDSNEFIELIPFSLNIIKGKLRIKPFKSSGKP